MRYVSTETAIRTLGVSYSTLLRWEKAGLIECVRSAAWKSQRRYNVDAFIERGRNMLRARYEREQNVTVVNRSS